MATSVSVGAEIAYTYDSNGNLATKTEGTDVWGYEWNAENQLTRVTKNSVEQARFAYDPAGRRVEKVAGGVTTSYVYDSTAILREVRGTTTLRYVHGPGIDEPLAVDDGTALSYFHADTLGSIVKVTNAAGAVALTRRYDAWGNLEAGSTEQANAFTGREWDPEVGLYYYRARYYDPKIGRFISEDPIGFAGGINAYSYVSANVTGRIDPLGLKEMITIHHYSTPEAMAARVADRIVANLALGGIDAGYRLTSEPSGVFGMMMPQALIPGSSFLLELRDSRAGNPKIKDQECGHMFAQALRDHAGVAMNVLRERAKRRARIMAIALGRELGPNDWEDLFVTAAANVATHEVGHAFARHSDGHSLMKHGGAQFDEWLFDPNLPWSAK